MKSGLKLPEYSDKALRDLHKVGSCMICHAAIYSFDPDAEDGQTLCKGEVCEHPDELFNDPKRLADRKRLYHGNRKLKNPCGFPRLRDQDVD